MTLMEEEKRLTLRTIQERTRKADKKLAHQTRKRSTSFDQGVIDRQQIQSKLRETLSHRMLSFSNPRFQRFSKKQTDTFAENTEKIMFQNFKISCYFQKYRSLIFNLGDVKNNTLIEKICAKEITPQDLVRLQLIDLASEQLSEMRRNINKQQLDLREMGAIDDWTQKTYIIKNKKISRNSS